MTTEERSEPAPTPTAVSINDHLVKREGRLDVNATLHAWRAAKDIISPEERAKRDAREQLAAIRTRRRATFNRILTGLGVTAFFLVGLVQFFGTSVRFVTTTPESAVVLADNATRTYASPPCAASGRITALGSLRRTNLREARRLRFAADEACVRACVRWREPGLTKRT